MIAGLPRQRPRRYYVDPERGGISRPKRSLQTVPIITGDAEPVSLYRSKKGQKMRSTLNLLAALLFVASSEGFVSHASADGIPVVHRAKKLRPTVIYRAPDCRGGTCTLHRPIACPDRYSCYSLYGAYGPYGGASYWARYTSDGWRAALVVPRR
jgi:hypothetical protein